MDEARALRDLADAAYNLFLKWKPRPKFTGAYARALEKLVDAARVFAAKSDEEWAAEVVELKAKVAELETKIDSMIDADIERQEMESM